MARALTLAASLVLLAASTASAVTKPTGELVAGSEETVLRLHDLPPGYQIGDDSGCGPLGPGEGDQRRGRLERRYLRWLVRYWPEACFYQYEQIFEVPGLGPAPPLVETQTLNTPGEAAGASGFKLYAAILNRSKEGRRRKAVSIAPSGARALLIRSRNELVEGKIHQPATFLFWRYGKLISFVEAAGMNPRRNDRAAFHFAQVQQERLEHPSPYTEAERDDTEVWLDDPSLKFPIYWVGRRFEPGQGLPATELEDAFTRAVGPPGEKATLWYEGFNLDAWTSRSWKRFQPTVLGRLNLKRDCVRKREVELEGGRAVVYAGYGRRHLRSCPEQPPDDYWAIARLGGMVIGVNLALCTRCIDHGDGPYDSLAGMRAILSALTLRPKPAY
jgi:hypothetical protein